MADGAANPKRATIALCARLTEIERDRRRMKPGDLARSLRLFGHQATAAGLPVAARVAAGAAQALTEQGHEALAANYLAALADAIGCDAIDVDAAGDACLAAVAVRMAG